MIINIKRTDSSDKHFSILIKLLDSELSDIDKEAHDICKQYNHIETITHVVIAYYDDNPVGCGAIRKYSEEVIEIKRMFVLNNYRDKGIATDILKELENWSKELNYKKCILETGKKLSGAIKFYQKNEYSQIPNYGQYQNMKSSICFEKELNNK